MFKLTESPAMTKGDLQLPELSIRLLENTPRLSLAPFRGEEVRVQNYLEQIGLGLPQPTEVRLGSCLILALGQGQWMLQGELPSLGELEGVLALSDQSDAWCGFNLQGSRVCAMLERLVAPAPHTYATGRAVRTQIEHIGCWVIGLAEDEWQILGPRSSAQSLFEALEHAAEAVDALTDN